MKELSWKPILRGGIYCAPACGGGCTRAAYNAAHVKGAALAHHLGAGWRVRVWENLGWHYTAVFEKPLFSIQVYPKHSHRDKFWVDLHVAGHQFCAHASNAKVGIRVVLEEAGEVARAFERGAAALKELQ